MTTAVGDAECEETVRRLTVVASPWLCPELSLHLATPDCALWRFSERDLVRLGLPEPFWAFPWPGGQVLARYLMDHPEVVRGRRVLDFGSGSAMVALAALRAGAASAVAADIDPFAAAAARLNARLAGAALEVTTDDLIGAPAAWDVVLAGDMLYEGPLAARVLAWLTGLASAGVLVLAGDPSRGHLPPGAAERVATYRAPTDVDPGGVHLRDASVWRLVPPRHP